MPGAAASLEELHVNDAATGPGAKQMRPVLPCWPNTVEAVATSERMSALKRSARVAIAGDEQ